MFDDILFKSFNLSDNEQIAPPVDMMGEPEWIKSLNPAQKQSVENVDGASLILAGAGTGKTRVITTRFAYILYLQKANPFQILCVTFTNKASQEMRDRVEKITGGISGSWIATFHSLCLRILRTNSDLAGLSSTFTILDDDDQVRLLKQIFVDMDLDKDRYPAKQMIIHIQRWKDKALMPSMVDKKEVSQLAGGRLGEAYERYQDRLKVLNAVDFGDLIMLVVDIFKKYPNVLNEYQNRFKYLLVDEYQDTNSAQYQWLKLLAGVHNRGDGSSVQVNICCVGDDDQSIYGWRGADVGNILRFETDFPNATVIKLEQNYRSTGHILRSANAIISRNDNRLGKNLFTDKGDGKKISVINVWDGIAEARHIGDVVKNSYKLRKESLAEMAILVRAGFQTRLFEERFISLNLPYRVIGGAKFYEREEIRDAVAYLRLINQSTDDLAFERVINKPARGIGNATIQKLQVIGRSRGVSLYQASTQILETDELATRAKNALRAGIEMFERWRKMSETENNTVVLETILNESGYLEYWRKSKDAKAPGKIDNLKELSTALEVFENIAGFLEYIALVMATDDQSNDDKISIMTLHSAKGLEFDRVFLAGWEDGLFPSERSLEETGQKGLEEERRLAYVGITRAKKYCHISFANHRLIHGKWISQIPSRFLEDLPMDSVLFTGGESPETKISNNSRNDYNWTDLDSDIDILSATLKISATGFKVGDRCFHQKFGMGTIASVDGDYLTIGFDNLGTKKIMATFVEKS